VKKKKRERKREVKRGVPKEEKKTVATDLVGGGGEKIQI